MLSLSLQVVLHSPDSIAAVGVLHPTAFHIELKGSHTASVDSNSTASEQQVVVEVPPDWQPQQQSTSSSSSSAAANPVMPPASTQQWETQVQASVSQQHVHVMCSAHAPGSTASSPASGDASSSGAAAAVFSAQDTAAALEAALLAVTCQLEALQGITSWQHSCFVHLYLADMSHFGVANAAYCKHLPQVNPPSRACVQVCHVWRTGHGVPA
jgi:diphthine-ammonia ligase